MTTNTITKVACPHCSEQLDPDYLCNTVVIEGDATKVCDSCLDDFDECGKCHKYHHKDNVNVTPKGPCDQDIICHDCADGLKSAYDEAMERKFDEMREEGRRYW